MKRRKNIIKKNWDCLSFHIYSESYTYTHYSLLYSYYFEKHWKTNTCADKVSTENVYEAIRKKKKLKNMYGVY